VLSRHISPGNSVLVKSLTTDQNDALLYVSTVFCSSYCYVRTVWHIIY